MPASPFSPRDSWIILLVAHGTVKTVDELPAFLAEIRRGRPPSPELLAEMRHRYTVIGGSPLLEETEAQAALVSEILGIEARVAMRLSAPRVAQVLGDVRRPARVCVLPIAPFSVNVYGAAAHAALRDQSDAPELVVAPPYGREPLLIEAWAEGIARARRSPDELVILTAHSLPQVVIDRGDPYRDEFEAAAALVAERIGGRSQIAYQSQGATDDVWLGPTLETRLREAKESGEQGVVVAPMGFLAEHVETLYDLDIEAKALSGELGLEFTRVPALGRAPAFGRALAAVVRRTIEGAEGTPLPS